MNNNYREYGLNPAENPAPSESAGAYTQADFQTESKTETASTGNTPDPVPAQGNPVAAPQIPLTQHRTPETPQSGHTAGGWQRVPPMPVQSYPNTGYTKGIPSEPAPPAPDERIDVPYSTPTAAGPDRAASAPGTGSTPNSTPTGNTPFSTPMTGSASGAPSPYPVPMQIPASGSAHGWNRPAGSTTQPPAPPKKPRRETRGGGKAGFVAAMLAFSLLGGAVGGGATYLALSPGGVSDPGSNANLVDTLNPGDAAPASTNTDSAVQAAASYLESSGTYTIAQIVQKASVSVVEISTEVQSTDFFLGSTTATASGSGVIVSEDGYIVTNDHVVEGALSITVRTSDGEEYDAVLIGTDSKTDLAVLKVDASGLAAVSMADSDTVQVGDLAVAIGNPLGTLGGTVTEGIISAKNRQITIGEETMTLLQTSAAVNPGNSGGGLFNGNGELVGVVNAKSYGVEIEGLGFAIPSNTVGDVVEDIIEHGYVTGRPQLGISIIEINNPQAALANRVDTYGVYIAGVTRDNGLHTGDRVVRINGQKIETGADITAFVENGEVGEILEFEIVRDGRTMTVEVDMVEKVPDYIKQSLESEKV